MVKDKKYWTKIATKILKTELAKRGINYNQLVDKLAEIGVEIKADDLRARVSRGTFGATLLIQCLKAVDVKNLPLEDSYFES